MNAPEHALRFLEVALVASLRGLLIATALGFAMTVVFLTWCSGGLAHLLEVLQRHPQA